MTAHALRLVAVALLVTVIVIGVRLALSGLDHLEIGTGR